MNVPSGIGPYVRAGTGFELGDAVGATPTLLFLNVSNGSGNITVAPKSPSGVSCRGATSVALENNGLSYVPYRCSR